MYIRLQSNWISFVPSPKLPLFFFTFASTRHLVSELAWILQDIRQACMTFAHPKQKQIKFLCLCLFVLYPNGHNNLVISQDSVLNSGISPGLTSINASCTMLFLCFSCFHHPFNVAFPKYGAALALYSGQALGACYNLFISALFLTGGCWLMRCCSFKIM